jgi:hypothetical protein
MNGLKYERLEINENKYRYSFEEESKDFEALEKLVSEHLPKDYSFSFKDLLIKTETSEINFFKTKIQNLDIKEQILLNSINDIKLSLKNEDVQIILFEANKQEKNENIDYAISSKVFNAINIWVHKTLHKKKIQNGKEIKECIFFDDLNNQQIELGENIELKEIDNKLICNLKEKNKYFEFIAIKAIMISLTNLMTELIQSYLTKNEKLAEDNDDEKKMDFDFEKIENLNLLEVNIFEEIYNDFVNKSNICSSELEDYFISSFDSFRKKYQMSFTLSELFTDIFWNSIFHNKKLCSLFLNSYFNEEIYGDIKIYLKKILKIIFGVQIPLKHQIVELLGLYQLENNEEIDLMTLIVSQKNRNHSKIIKSEIEKENLNRIINKTTSEENNKNSNNKNPDNNNNNSIKQNNNNNISNKNDEEIKYNVITANDISVLKNRKQNSAPPNNSNINNTVIISENINNIEKPKENKVKDKEENNKNYLNKKKSNDNFGTEDMEHKTVDEIYNYINEGKIVKSKKKKKSRKNKKAKKEEIIEKNQEEIEDSIVLQFKEDLSDKLIHARTITKIKPIISDKWIKNISNDN